MIYSNKYKLGHTIYTKCKLGDDAVLKTKKKKTIHKDLGRIGKEIDTECKIGHIAKLIRTKLDMIKIK